jgi:MFS family permease
MKFVKKNMKSGKVNSVDENAQRTSSLSSDSNAVNSLNYCGNKLMLSMICFVQFSIIYTTETPGGLEDIIIKVMKIDTTQYTLMYSLYSWPSVITCFVSGFLVDRLFGLNIGYIIFVGISTLGQIILVIGALSHHYSVMLFGRFLIGTGNEMVYVMHKAYVALWFKDHNLAFALSLEAVCGRIGGIVALGGNHYFYTTVSLIIQPMYRLGITLLVGLAFLIVSFMVSIVLMFVMLNERNEVIESSSILSTDKEKKERCKKLEVFPFSFWLVALIISIYYSVLNSFTSIGQNFFVAKFGYSVVLASLVNGVIFGGSIALMPLFGILIDAVGYYVYWGFFAIVVYFITQVIFQICSPHSFYIPIILGILPSLTYSIVASSIWGLPAFIVKVHQISTAYGIIGSFSNLGLSVLSVVAGVLIDTCGYFVTGLLYWLALYFALLLTVWLLIVDYFFIKKLNKSRFPKSNKF